MTTPVAALIVSIASACITLSGIIWQLALFKLSGARLRVQLVFEFTDGAMVTSVVGTKRKPRASFSEALNRDLPDRFGIECVRVRVTNVGRSPVSVENISLDLGRTQWWRRYRTTMTPSRFKNEIYEDLRPAELTTTPIRLEVGAVASMVFHLWPALNAHLDELQGKKRLKVRGTAQAAGRRPTLSSRRVSWRFRQGENTWFTDREVTPETLVYRELWYQSYVSFVGTLPLAMHRQVSERLRAGASVDDIKEYLDELNPDGVHHMAAHQVHQAFHSTARTDEGPKEVPPSEASTPDPAVGGDEGTGPTATVDGTQVG